MTRTQGAALLGGLLVIATIAVPFTHAWQSRVSSASSAPTDGQTVNESLNDEVSKFVATSSAKKMMCAMAAQSAQLRIEMGDDRTTAQLGVTECVKKTEEEVRIPYRHLMASLTSDAARNALKNFYANWLSAVEAVSPNYEETPGELSARQDLSDANLQVLGNQLRVEIDN